MDQEAKDIRATCLRLSWCMRGGASYEDVLTMSDGERQAISKLTEENMETTNKTRLPYF